MRFIPDRGRQTLEEFPGRKLLAALEWVESEAQHGNGYIYNGHE